MGSGLGQVKRLRKPGRSFGDGVVQDVVDAVIRGLTASLLVLLAPTAVAGPWAPYNGNAERQNMVSADAYKKIDFLTPSPVPEPQVFSNCIVTYDTRPAFFRDRHWCLRLDASHYLLDSWESPAKADAKEPEHHTIQLPPDVAKLIQDIWLNAILEAHYPRFNPNGLDGQDFYFGAMRDDSRMLLRAETWSPESDLPPRWLADVGAQLFKYAQAGSDEPAELRTTLSDLRDRLFSYYEKHGRH